MPLPTSAWAYVVLIVVLLVSAVTDIRGGKIYNWITYPAMALGLIGHALFGGLSAGEESIGLFGSLAGLAVGFLPLVLAWSAGWIGGGDAKLMGAIGALGGWRLAVAAMFYGFVVGALMAVIVMTRRRVVRRTLGRIGRFLYLALAPGAGTKLETKDSPTVPFGLALCIGGAAAVVEAIVRGPAAPKWILGF